MQGRLQAPTATLSADGQTVTFSRALWSHTFPTHQLADMLARYCALRDRDGGKYAAFYRDDVAALEAVKAQVEARRQA